MKEQAIIRLYNKYPFLNWKTENKTNVMNQKKNKKINKNKTNSTKNKKIILVLIEWIPIIIYIRRFLLNLFSCFWLVKFIVTDYDILWLRYSVNCKTTNKTHYIQCEF
jgi:hypothetical protein